MKDIYQAVTNQIIAALEAGTAPWVCPWTRTGGSMLPANASSSRPYRGINVLLLQMQAAVRGYDRHRWLTFNQARALGAHVRRGEEGAGIVFFKMHEVDGASMQPASNDAPGRRVIPFLRSFTVFNVAQVDGLPEALTAVPAPPADWTPIAEAEAVLQRSGAVIRHGGMGRRTINPAVLGGHNGPRVTLPPGGPAPQARSSQPASHARGWPSLAAAAEFGSQPLRCCVGPTPAHINPKVATRLAPGTPPLTPNQRLSEGCPRPHLL